MVNSIILGRNKISGRAPSGIVIRRETNKINDEIKRYLNRRDVSGAQTYLRSIAGRGSYPAVNQLISSLQQRIGGNLQNPNVRQAVTQNVTSAVSQTQKFAEAKVKVGKANLARASATVTKPRATELSRIVTQKGTIYRVTPDGTFSRIGFTKEEEARRKRIKQGTATARDIYSGVNTQSASGQNIVLQRLAPSIERIRRFENQYARMVTAGQQGQVSEKVKQITTKPVSNLTKSDITFLQKRADAINKRGQLLDQNEQAIYAYLKNKISKGYDKLYQFSEKVDKKIKTRAAKKGITLTKEQEKTLQKSNLTTKNFNKVVTDILAQVGTQSVNIPLRFFQYVDKQLFLNQGGAVSAIRGDARRFFSALGKEQNTVIQKAVLPSLKQAVKDPSTYFFALLGARLKAETAGILKPVGVLDTNLFSSTSKSYGLVGRIKALRGKTVVDYQGNIYKVGERGNVIKISTRPTITAKRVSASKGGKLTKAERRKGVTRTSQRETLSKQKQEVKSFLIPEVTKGKKYEASSYFEKGKPVLEIREVPTVNITQKSGIILSRKGKKARLVSKEDITKFDRQQAAQARALYSQKDSKKPNYSAVVINQRPDGRFVRLEYQRIGGKEKITRRIVDQKTIKAQLKQQKYSRTQATAKQKAETILQASPLEPKYTSQLKSAIERNDKRAIKYYKKLEVLGKQQRAKIRRLSEGKQQQAVFDIRADVKTFMRELNKPQDLVLGKPKSRSTKSKVLSKAERYEKLAVAEAKKAGKRISERLQREKALIETKERSVYKSKSLTKQNEKTLNRVLEAKEKALSKALGQRSKVKTLLKTLSGVRLSLSSALQHNLKNNLVVETIAQYTIESVKRVPTKIPQKPKKRTQIRKPTPTKLAKTTTTTVKKPVSKKRIVRRGRNRIREVIKPKITIKIPDNKPPLSVKNPKGYDAYVKVQNRWVKYNKQPYSKAGAAQFGRWLTNNSTARSFVIVGVNKKGAKVPEFVQKTSSKLFRSPKKKSRLAPQTIIERAKFAINTAGEKRGLKAAQFLARVAKSRKQIKTSKTKRKRATKRK